MERVGVRELRQHASRYLRRTAAGESFEVTDRGRPVARLLPPAALEGIERLRAEGRVTEATLDLLELGPPLPPKPGVPPLSEIVAADRADER